MSLNPPPRPRARPSQGRREEILVAAVALADREGLEVLSMRSLAAEVGMTAMSLYRHVQDKDDLLDALVELIHRDFSLPGSAEPRRSLAACYAEAFEVLLKHPWAAGLALSRPALGPQRLRRADAVAGALEAMGCSLQQAHTAIHALDTHLFGFALQVHTTWSPEADVSPLAADVLRGEHTQTYPHLSPVIRGVTHHHRDEFLSILDLLLDAIGTQAHDGDPAI